MTNEGVVMLAGLAVNTVALLGSSFKVGKWTARIQTLVEGHAVEIASLRESRHKHANALADHGARITNLEGEES